MSGDFLITGALAALLTAGAGLAFAPVGARFIAHPADKFLHGLYCWLAVLFLDRVALGGLQDAFLLGAIVLAAGAAAEVAQSFAPNRRFSVGDLAANAVGVALGVLTLLWVGAAPSM